MNFSKRDHERDLKRSFSRTIFVTGTNSVTSSLAQDASDVIATSFSPSKSRTAVLRQLTDGDKKRFVEVWQGDSLVVSRDVTATHGPFYTEGAYHYNRRYYCLTLFADALISLSFSPSENLLIYTAEGLEPNTTKGDDQYDRFRYTPHFGEGFPGKKRPTLYLLRLQSSKEENEDEVPSNLSPLSFPQFAVPTLLGQAVFISEDRIIATGYEYMRSGRLLGLKGCLNRPTGVWQFDLSKSDNDLEKLSAISIQRLTPSSLSARSPRVLSRSTGQSKAIWIANTLGGAHASCSSIHSLDIATGKERTLVDIVWEPTQGGFPGLYTDFSLPSSPFLEIGSTNFLVTHSTWSSRFTVLLVNLETGEVKDLTPDQDDLLYSWTVLCTDGRNRIICVRSSFSIPPEVVLGSFDENLTISWQVLSKPTLNLERKHNQYNSILSCLICTYEVESLLKTIKATVIKIPDHHPVETVLVRTIQEVPDKLEGASASKPCVASPHGGPHANVGTFFTASYIALALEGCESILFQIPYSSLNNLLDSVSLINYTGSVGYGETYVRKLLGKCGTLDVEDCIASVNHLIDIGQSTKGPGMQLIQGGSHGGFLAAHCA